MKKRYTVEIGGMELNVLTDETEEYVHGLAKIIDSRITSMTASNKHCTKNEAAVFCALDYLDDKLKTTLSLEEAKKQISELTMEVQRLKKELNDKKN